MPRKTADQTVSRADVLRAAARVFRLRGYHGTTMQHIADELGLRQSSLYHYFPSKRVLLLTLLSEGLERMTKYVSQAAQPDLPPDARLAAAILAYLSSVAAYPNSALVTIFETRALLDTPEERRAYIERRDTMERFFASIIEEGVRVGIFLPCDISIMTKLLFSILNWFVMWYRPEGRLSLETVAQMISDFFIAGLQNTSQPMGNEFADNFSIREFTPSH